MPRNGETMQRSCAINDGINGVITELKERGVGVL